MLIAIEGIDASGKATQSRLLAEYLKTKGYISVVKSFPDYTTQVGKIIKAILSGQIQTTNTSDIPREIVNAYILQSLMSCDRHAMTNDIEAASETYSGEQARALICDRYWLSGIVYGTDDGIDPFWLMSVLAKLPEPDMWIFLNVPMEEVARRLKERSRIENRPLDLYEKNLKKLERIRGLYLRHFEAGDFTIAAHTAIVDGVGTADEVHQRVVSALLTR